MAKAGSAFGLLSVSFLALAVGVPAYAQNNDASDDRQHSGLSEIIVTAQKREQSLQDVPIAVTAVTGDALEVNRVTTITDLSALAPGFVSRPTMGDSSIPFLSMRGLLSAGLVPGSDKSISIYVDGVYLAATRGAIFELPDVERIEVLRGPQGTLFGRNSDGGAVSIYTREPTGEAQVKASATVGARDHYRFRVTADTPQIGPFSAYGSFVHSEIRGPVRNALAGQTYYFLNGLDGFNRSAKAAKYLGSKRSDSMFAAVKFEPSTDFKMVYKYDRNEASDTPNAIGAIGYDATSYFAPLYAALINSQDFPVELASNGRRPKVAYNGFQSASDDVLQGHNLTATYNLNDQVTIKNIAAHRSSTHWVLQNTDGLTGLIYTPEALAAFPYGAQYVGSPYVFLGHAPLYTGKQWSNELQVNFASDFVSLTAGGLYYKSQESTNAHGYPNTTNFQPVLNGVVRVQPGVSFNETESIAGYMQAEFHVTSQLDLVAGGRVTRDKKFARFSYGNPTALTELDYDYRDTRFTYLLGANYKPNNDILLYGKWSTGYLSGGTVGPVVFDAETAKSAEIGFKGDLLDRRLRANVAAYWVKYKNYQAATAASVIGDLINDLVDDPALGQVLGTFVFSRGDIEAKGVELELTAAPTDGVTLGGNLSYTDVKALNVPDFAKANVGLPVNAPDNAFDLPWIPKWTGGVWAQYTSQPIFGDAYLLARLDGIYTGGISSYGNDDVFANNPVLHQAARIPSYWMLNGRIGLKDIDLGGVKTELALWGKNILDEDTRAFSIVAAGVVSANYVDARSYGVDLTIQF